MENAITRLYLVRHCQSMGNLQNIFQGQHEYDVSPVGEQQLALLSLRFRNIHLDAIYSSPLQRAAKTAEAINAYHNLPITPLDDLMEIDVGELEAKPLSDLPVQYPVLSRHWNETPQDCVFPGGESMHQVFDRASSALRTILAESAGMTVLVASHGCLLRNMACALLYGTIDALPQVVLSGNTSVSEFEISASGVQVVRMNDLSHLPPELRGDPHQYDLKK